MRMMVLVLALALVHLCLVGCATHGVTYSTTTYDEQGNVVQVEEVDRAARALLSDVDSSAFKASINVREAGDEYEVVLGDTQAGIKNATVLQNALAEIGKMFGPGGAVALVDAIRGRDTATATELIESLPPLE